MLLLLQIGGEGVGKTTFINTLAAAFPHSQAAAATAPPTAPAAMPTTSSTGDRYPNLGRVQATVTIDDPDTEIRHNFVLQVSIWTLRFLQSTVCCLTQLMTPVTRLCRLSTCRPEPDLVQCFVSLI